MVAKIIEDEAQKLATSSNNLNFFNQTQQQKIQYSRQESKKRLIYNFFLKLIFLKGK